MPVSVYKKLPLLMLLAAVAQADDRPEYSGAPLHNGTQRAHYIGDRCQNSCSAILQNAFCNMTVEQCQCLHEFPVIIDNLICEKPRRLNDLCRYDRVCQHSDDNTECRSQSDATAPRCRCRQFYQPTTFRSSSGHMYCIKDPFSQLLQPDPSTVLSLILVLSVVMLLMCMALRLFHRARHARARGYGDANLPPPPPPLSSSELDLTRNLAHEQQRYHGDRGRAELVTPSDPSHVTSASRMCNGHVSHGGGSQLLTVQDDEYERRWSGSSIHSSFSTCTYGLPENIANKIRAQKQMQPRNQMSNGTSCGPCSNRPTSSATRDFQSHTHMHTYASTSYLHTDVQAGACVARDHGDSI